MSIILASASPRRSELLGRMGLDFTVLTAPHDETMDPFADPSDEVARVSLLKAQAVLPRCQSGDIVIAADTIVVCDGLTMGKPRSESDAFSMLRRLSGREHQVMTGLTVLQDGFSETVTVTTGIRMRFLADDEIRAYIATGEPMDKAGSYALQGIAGLWVEEISGSASNVIGLPLTLTRRLLQEAGLNVLGLAASDGMIEN